MLWVANLVEGVNQGVLMVGLERKVEVDRGLGLRVPHALPVLRNGIPCMHYLHSTPTLCERSREAAEKSSGKDGEHKEGVGSHATEDH